VEPAHPEHKRAFEGDEGIEEPSEKRLRPTDSVVEEDDSLEEEVAKAAGISTTLLASIAVAAIAVLVAFRMKKK
jgi:hypothetical protein